MPRAQLFVTCIVDSIFPQVGEAVVDLLERLGVEVEFPESQTCCGQPAYNAGFRDEARALAVRFLDVFQPHPLTPSPDASSGEGEGVAQSAGVGGEVVTPSGSCAAMIVHGFPDLFRDDPVNLARARALAARTCELSQYLVSVLKVGDVGARFAGRLAYHPSCHLTRGLGVTEAPIKLLQHVAGAELVPLEHSDECCGFGGMFAIKHGDISSAMLERKLDDVRASGADTVVGCDMSCLMHLQGGLSRDGSPIRCLHLAEVLAGRST